MATWGADARYTRLVRDHGDGLLHLAILLTGNRHDGDDVEQDVLISVAKAWPVARPLPYLKRAVANRAVDIMRKRREVLTDAPPEVAYIDQRLLEHEDQRRFFDLVQALPPRQREVLVLRYNADLDDATIAKTLGITVSTVRSQAQQALEKLRASVGVSARKEES